VARMDDIRRQYPHAYEKWTRAEEQQLLDAGQEGCTVEAIAARLGRQPSAIVSRQARIAEEGMVPEHEGRFPRQKAKFASPIPQASNEEVAAAAELAADQLGDGEICLAMLDALATSVDSTQAAVASLRWGLDGTRRLTLRDIGERLGISGERVRQREAKLLRQISGCARRAWRGADAEDPWLAIAARTCRMVRPDQPDELAPRLLDFLTAEFGRMRIDAGVGLVRALTRGSYDVPAVTDQIVKLVRRRAEDRKRQRAVQRLDDRLNALLVRSAVWPSECRQLPWPSGRVRDPNPDSIGIVGEFESAKLGRPVAYESLTEYVFLMRLERSDLVTRYHEQPVAIPLTNHRRRSFYCPDVLVELRDGRHLLIEVKPDAYVADHENLAAYTVLDAFCAHHGLAWLVTNGYTSLRDVLRLVVTPEFAADVLTATSGHTLGWQAIRPLLRLHRVTLRELNALVLRGGLSWSVDRRLLLRRDDSLLPLVQRIPALADDA
jgi:Sigma-70, region 4